jgi:hypothetical protein
MTIWQSHPAERANTHVHGSTLRYPYPKRRALRSCLRLRSARQPPRKELQQHRGELRPPHRPTEEVSLPRRPVSDKLTDDRMDFLALVAMRLSWTECILKDEDWPRYAYCPDFLFVRDKAQGSSQTPVNGSDHRSVAGHASSLLSATYDA